MNFDAFCRAHGLVMDSLPTPGKWVRVATVDHPRSKNGAAKYMGDHGWCQNHACMTEVAFWKPDGDTPHIDREGIARQAAEFDRKARLAHQHAAQAAETILRGCKPAEHPYLSIKGFPDARGFVADDEALCIPMRGLVGNQLQGLQVIRWLPEERKYEKKMLHGMRAKGAVFRIGSPQAARTWLVEGYATGLSVEAALRVLRLRDSVLVCFSAGNLKHVAAQLTGDRIVFADNDASGTGERIARETGLPWCMSSVVGEDANDLHARAGVFALAEVLMSAIHEADTVT